MKKIALLLILVAFAGGRISATAVSQSQALNIATHFFKLQSPVAAANPSLALSLVYTQTENNGNADFYVFNVSPMKGFVIISADDYAMPVIAYSTESNFVSGDFSRIGLSDWMKSTAVRINYLVTNHIAAPATVQNLWTSYAAGISPQNARSGTVGPLLDSLIWNQSPYYNALCPPAALASTDPNKSVTGCVATAMAQIMKYWSYPAQGTGNHSYNDATSAGYTENYGTLSADFTRPLYWSAMPANVTTNNSAVDSLMYELGVAVDMDYSPSGSGAFVLQSEAGPGNPCAESVYQDNFYYNPNTLQGVYLSSYSNNIGGWIALMENEINSGRVVQYEGQDPTQGGHTWVMDGYDANDNLHMNWGWGGYCDGYFAVTNLQTANGGFNPSQNDAALIGIEPLLPFNVTVSPSNPAICPSGSTNLSIQGPANATYTWTPSTGLSCPTCASTSANPNSTTFYTVTIDSAGVTANISVTVTVTSPVAAGFNFTSAPSCQLPENVIFNNTSSNATGYSWTFGDGATSTDVNPQHSYTADGSYLVELYATNTCGMDSLISSTPVVVTGGPPVVASPTICIGQTAVLSANGTNTINWFSDSLGTNLMDTGATYTTAPLPYTVRYYVGSVITPAQVEVGPVSDAIGASSEYTNPYTVRGSVFNCSVAQTLVSVRVYATGAGPRTFILEDSLGNILDSSTQTLYNGQQTVTLNFNLPVATSMMLGILGTTNLTRTSSGAVYPYVSADGTVTITGNNAGAPGRYYFCYNWQLQQSGCNTTLTPVNVYVLSSGGVGPFWASGSGTPTVTFTPADLTASSYSWSFGDGSTSTQMNPVHTYAAGGTYTVQLILSNGSCADTITQSVDTKIVAGMNNINGFSEITVAPNPANDVVSLSVSSSKQLSDCLLTVHNVLGQSSYAQSVNLEAGSNKFNIDLSGLSAGVYFVSLQNGDEKVTTRFIKE